jgi:hypothetical protein
MYQLNYHEELNHTSNTSGALVAGPFTFRLTRIGRVVNLLVPDIFGTATNTILMVTNFPARFQPAGQSNIFCIAQNGVDGSGVIRVNLNEFRSYWSTFGNFTSGNSIGSYHQEVLADELWTSCVPILLSHFFRTGTQIKHRSCIAWNYENRTHISPPSPSQIP